MSNCHNRQNKSLIPKGLIEYTMERQKSEDGKKINLIWLEAWGCSDNFISLLNAKDPDVVYFLNSMVNMIYNNSLMADEGSLAFEKFMNTLDTEFIFVVEGAVSLKENGLYNAIASHYLESIEYSRLAHKMLSILGGKAPHNHGIFVGGVTINMDGSFYIEIKSILTKIVDFAENIMFDDINFISKHYEDYFLTGRGYGNFLSYGLFPDNGKAELVYVKPGVYLTQKIQQVNLNLIKVGIKGVVEQAFIGTKVKDTDAYAQILRSFDPGVSGAIHILSSLYEDLVIRVA